MLLAGRPAPRVGRNRVNFASVGGKAGAHWRRGLILNAAHDLDEILAWREERTSPCTTTG